MKVRFPGLLLALPLALTPAQSLAQGASDLFLVKLRETQGALAVDTVSRVTNRNGYNNQPGFSRDGRTLFYTAIDSAGQADIWRHRIGSGTTERLTVTSPESEYSAAQIPGQERISVIRVEKDSAQRLWSFKLDGTDPQLLLAPIKPVGYQAWIDGNRVAAFVLGSPATLQLVDVRSGTGSVIASGIGRALQKVPARAAVSFTRRDSANTRWIDVYDVTSGTIAHAAKTLANEYHVWLPDGMLLSATGSSVYTLMPGRDADWVLLADLADRGIKGISRLAVSPDGKWLAVVAAH